MGLGKSKPAGATMLPRISRNAHQTKNKEARIHSKAASPHYCRRMTIGARLMGNCEAQPASPKWAYFAHGY